MADKLKDIKRKMLEVTIAIKLARDKPKFKKREVYQALRKQTDTYVNSINKGDYIVLLGVGGLPNSFQDLVYFFNATTEQYAVMLKSDFVEKYSTGEIIRVPKRLAEKIKIAAYL